MELYVKNKKMIADHNAAYKQGKVSYEMEINQWADQARNIFSAD